MGSHTDSVAAAAPAAIRQRTIRIDDVTTPVRESGPADAEDAVVFVHGNPGSGEDWTSLVAEVGAFGRAVAPDMPGYGRAGTPDEFDYTIDGYAGHLHRVMEQVGVRRAHLVLHDFGGPWGLAWAARHPDRFLSATLINTGLVGVLPGSRWHYLARIWRTPLLGELFMATVTRTGMRVLLKHGNPRGLPRQVTDRMYADFDRRTRRAVLRLYRATSDRDERRARKTAAALCPLDRPALVLWGASDPYLPVSSVDRHRELFPSARVVVLDGSGHWPMADNPRAVAREVVPFLRQQLAPGSGSGSSGSGSG